MSISSLPEWRQLLLDRKRKGEETRERQVREDEKRLANMPAWKREVIQRRKAKQEGDGGSQTVDGRAVAENTSEAALPEGSWSTCAQGIKNGPEPQSQVSVENIGLVQHNPFILSQNVWRAVRRECREDLGPDSRAEGRGGVNRTGEGDPLKEEQSEEFGSCQRDHNIDCDGKKPQNVKCKRTGDGGEGLRRKGDREQKHPGTEYPVCSLSVPCLRTMPAENVITAELGISATGKVLRNKRREEEIKPLASVKDRSAACQLMYSERKGSRSGTEANEERHEKEEVIEALGEKEEVPGGDKARSRIKVGGVWPNVQEKTGEKEAKADSSIRGGMEAGASVESFGHVSRLLSKFGEQYKHPLQSKSMDCFTSHDEGGGRGSMEEESALRGKESWSQRKEKREEVQGFPVKGL